MLIEQISHYFKNQTLPNSLTEVQKIYYLVGGYDHTTLHILNIKMDMKACYKIVNNIRYV